MSIRINQRINVASYQKTQIFRLHETRLVLVKWFNPTGVNQSSMNYIKLYLLVSYFIHVTTTWVTVSMYAVYLCMTDNGIIMYHESINIFILPGNNNTGDSFNVIYFMYFL